LRLRFRSNGSPKPTWL